jgi:hypothetical protein
LPKGNGGPRYAALFYPFQGIFIRQFPYGAGLDTTSFYKRMKLLRTRLRRALRVVLGGAVLGITFASSLRAQDSVAPHDTSVPSDAPSSGVRRIAPPQKTWEIWSAAARNAPLKTRYGVKRDRELYITGIRWSKQLGRRKGGMWEYTNDFLPIVVATKTPFYRDTSFTRTIRIPGRFGGDEYITQRIDSLILFNRTVYGFGWVPLGIRYRRGNQRVQLVMGLSGGAVYFNRRMPDPGETRFNFTLDGTVLADIPITRMHGISVGYRFNHISNAYTGRVNPGMNSSMLQLGWVIRRPQTR